jgi:hypothetical protein
MRLPATVEIGNRITAWEAAKRYGVKLNTLDHRIDDGLIPGAEAIPVGQRTVRLIDPAVFEEYLANRPKCGKDGCDRTALIGSDGCCGPHARAIATKGTSVSDETRARMSAGKEFKPRPDVAERMKRDWREGGPMTRGLFFDEDGNAKPFFKGDTRRVWKLKWAPKPGRPPEEYHSQETRARICELRDANPPVSWKDIVEETGVPESTARSIYAAQRRS